MNVPRIFLWHKGQKQSVVQLAMKYRIPTYQIYNRLKMGWSVDDALFKPKSPRGRPRKW